MGTVTPYSGTEMLQVSQPTTERKVTISQLRRSNLKMGW